MYKETRLPFQTRAIHDCICGCRAELCPRCAPRAAPAGAEPSAGPAPTGAQRGSRRQGRTPRCAAAAALSRTPPPRPAAPRGRGRDRAGLPALWSRAGLSVPRAPARPLSPLLGGAGESRTGRRVRNSFLSLRKKVWGEIAADQLVLPFCRVFNKHKTAGLPINYRGHVTPIWQWFIALFIPPSCFAPRLRPSAQRRPCGVPGSREPSSGGGPRARLALPQGPWGEQGRAARVGQAWDPRPPPARCQARRQVNSGGYKSCLSSLSAAPSRYQQLCAPKERKRTI